MRKQLAAPIRAFLRARAAVTALEYAIVAGAVALTVIGAVGVLGQAVLVLYQKVLP